MSEQEELTDDEILDKLAKAMKENPPTQEEKQSLYTFLFKVVEQLDSRKIANLRDDKDLDEIGRPKRTVRGSLKLVRISDLIMNNTFFKDYFAEEAEEALSTSLSRGGFLVRQATMTTKQIADITKRKKTEKKLFGREKTEESGGDTLT